MSEISIDEKLEEIYSTYCIMQKYIQNENEQNEIKKRKILKIGIKFSIDIFLFFMGHLDLKSQQKIMKEQFATFESKELEDAILYTVENDPSKVDEAYKYLQEIKDEIRKIKDIFKAL